MNKGIIIAGVLILVIGGVFVASQTLNNSQDDKLMQDDTSAMREESMEGDKMDDGTSDSRYVKYASNTLESTSDTRRVLYFYANWCPTCRPADADFSANESRIPSDVTVIRVNYNDTDTDAEEEALAREYGITYQHTFVQIDENGEQVAKWNGGDTDELLLNIK